MKREELEIISFPYPEHRTHDFTGVGEKSHMEARMRSVFQMALSQCLIFRLGFNHMGNVGVLL